MVFTRSQTTPAFTLSSFSLLDAAKALVSLHNSTVTPQVTSTRSSPRTPTPSVYTRVAPAAPARAAAPVVTPAPAYSKLNDKLWNSWTEWYHAFLSEATDEKPSLPIADRRAMATSRWVTFASKSLRCSESDVRAWLRTANQKDLLAACA